MQFSSIDKVIQEEGLNVYNVLYIAVKYLAFALHPCEAGAGR
jgi:hypothetical protein